MRVQLSVFDETGNGMSLYTVPKYSMVTRCEARLVHLPDEMVSQSQG